MKASPGTCYCLVSLGYDIISCVSLVTNDIARLSLGLKAIVVVDKRFS